MTHQPDVPRRSEATWIAMSAASEGPWVAALAGGAAVGLADFAMRVFGWDLSLADPLALGLSVFFLIGAGGALLRGGHHRARAWAQQHPWSYAWVPAAGTAVTVFASYLFLSAQGLFGSLWEGLSDGFGVLVLLGIIGYVARGLRPASRRG
ncbi:hypothetical protein NE236_04160 [Actinoallomurus purpureus]|uniref:hypothetical protein n=1 Tax=Actinoallomurus purpureus TaxID=478114 RepID=UPI002093EF5C|nr:hypothetical protein [Actinoallomurus purpureus]MCO6004165.1 hypothetical protein [Actinoallomurus purpureus]